MFLVLTPRICRDVGCKTVANMIKGKSPEEIRKLFNIVNDFTPEEEVRFHIIAIITLQIDSHVSTYRLKSRRRTSGRRIDERLKNPNVFFLLVIELFCSSLHSFVHEPPCSSYFHPPAFLTILSSAASPPLLLGTLLLGTPTCLHVIPRYSAAAPNKYSITNCETLPRRSRAALV
jgi:hypothetical protein